jgi:hypothetical protein
MKIISMIAENNWSYQQTTDWTGCPARLTLSLPHKDNPPPRLAIEALV